MSRSRAAPATSPTQTVIIGAGLSGLALASLLERAGRDWCLIEARPRLGGRILSVPACQGDLARYDMGPAWIWPHNRRLLGLVCDLGLRVFEQHSDGNLVFQDAAGQVRRDLAFATMAGALRVAGGLGALVDGLAGRLDMGCVRLSHRIEKLTLSGSGVVVCGATPDGPFEVAATRAVLALPPRIVADTISVEPPLPPGLTAAFRAIPTWMAGHAKLVAVYDTPFWRAAGLSGDGVSHTGPLAEIHDASPAGAAAGALFGFVATAPAMRAKAPEALKTAAIAQLTEMFGREAASPRAVLLEDWASAPFTATPADHAPLAGHPTYGPPPALSGWTDPRLCFAGTELAPDEGGFLEGALSAAESVAADIAPPA